MPISIFNLFSIGIGPSSSHTVGPMRAAYKFAHHLKNSKLIDTVDSVKVDLYGSLALTGKGHGTDLAILLGLEGETPEGVDPDTIQDRIQRIKKTHHLNLLGSKILHFDESHLVFHYDEQLPYHPNAMRFSAFGPNKETLFSCIVYSVGGGFIVNEEEAKHDVISETNESPVPYYYNTAQKLLDIGKATGLSIAQIVMENEKTKRSEEEIRKGILHICEVMSKCIQRGCEQDGILPGGLNLPRRAKKLFMSLKDPHRKKTPVDVMQWVSLWALSVNEENASGARVVTAPTNGSSGVIPAVIKYYETYCEGASQEGIITFMLTACAIGILFKQGASISAAEMGCMGEVGVACSMAAAGLCAALGGTNEQIENAAEIGMEHNLGLTCDPIKGLVQIPCIERNTMGAVKAINAAMLALQGDGNHFVSLDHVIATMRETGQNMKSIYKETSLGGLATNVPEC